MSFTVRGDDLGDLASAMRHGADVLDDALGRSLLDLGEPLGMDAIEAGARVMPRRGGLADLVRGSTPSASLRGFGGDVEVEIEFEGDVNLNYLDRGSLRHPVYGTDTPWVDQSVTAGAFSRGFEEGESKVRDAGEAAIDDTLDSIARRAT